MIAITSGPKSGGTPWSRIGRLTLTTALFKMARCEVFAEATSTVRAQAQPVTPAARTGQTNRPPKSKSTSWADSPGGPPTKGAKSATGWPSGQCFKWCKSGDCEYTTAQNGGASSSTPAPCAKYGHDPAHKGKFPNAVMPTRK